MAINWSAIDRRSVLGTVLRFSLGLIPAKSLIKIRQGPAEGMKWIAGSGTHGCWLGTYELEKQKMLQHLIRPGMTIYDIGAQAGFFSLFFSQLIGETGLVYAFEPYPENVQNLLCHLRINQVRNCRVVQAALNETTSLSGFTFERGKLQNALTGPWDSSLIVSTLSIDEAVALYGLKPPDLLKIDVEGTESRVLCGAKRVLETHNPILFLALHDEEQKEKCFNFLMSAGYQPYDLKGTPLLGELKEDEVYALKLG